MNQKILKIISRIKENLRDLKDFDLEEDNVVDEIYESLSEIEELIYEEESDVFQDEEEGF